MTPAAAATGMLAPPGGAARAASVTARQAAVPQATGPQATGPHLTGFHQIVVDDAEGHLFLSEGEDSAAITGAADASTALVATTRAGAYVTTLDADDGVEGLALAPDGNRKGKGSSGGRPWAFGPESRPRPARLTARSAKTFLIG